MLIFLSLFLLFWTFLISQCMECDRSMHFGFQESNQSPLNAVWVVLRGQTFRMNSLSIQKRLLSSIQQFVFHPIKQSFPLMELNVHLCAPVHKNNLNLLEVLKSYSELQTISFQEYDAVNKTQLQNWLGCVPQNLLSLNKTAFTIIIRNDLLFLERLNVSAIQNNKFYCQWNLWHNCESKEMADQIQGIGGLYLKPLYDKIQENQTAFPNHDLQKKNWKDQSMHNFYNYFAKHFGKSNIAYFNDYSPNQCFTKETSAHCNMRGRWSASSTKEKSPKRLFIYDREIEQFEKIFGSHILNNNNNN